ncbi:MULTISPECIES: hypothetical protein [Enterobacterales]|uniref:hypothetical protein n=1 Tax=Enterobacterales TaxID=91347 RepID=UPI00084824AD|nr:MULTISPECIES: hypothetical protein [Enterobacterales]ODQ08143.1 hypothetical protein BGK50_12535 [Shigella sp. FC130]OEI93237.1 hypothetical protein BHE86_05415 [Shigella sp. FC1655]WOO49421.1 hypothetical protein R2S03_18455 [Hafnia alvei]WPF03887.1 hypothetical protein SB028_17280 [Proteus vulgaris]
MNVTSIFRDTASQLTMGIGKVISNIVDFFSNLSSGITGLFNSNTPFRQVSTGSKSDGLELINFCKNIEFSRGTSLFYIEMFLNSQCEMEGLDKSKYNSIYGSVDSGYNSIYGSVDSRYNSIYDSGESRCELKDSPEEHEYEEINLPEENTYESIDENNSVTVEDVYSEVFDSTDFYEEDIYTSPSDDTLSEENNYDTIPTDDELFRLFFTTIENGTKFNTL